MERQVAHLKQALADKHEQEAATVQVCSECLACFLGGVGMSVKTESIDVLQNSLTQRISCEVQ